MKRDELTKILRQEYSRDSKCGVARAEDELYKNAKFVVPPPPPYEHPARLPVKAIARAHDVLNKITSIDDADEIEKLVSYLFVRREAVQSSRMEGTWSTIDEISFRDGNGRVGRVLMTLQMACTRRLPIYISGFIESEKSNYAAALSLAQKKEDYGSMIEFICEALVQSYQEAQITEAAIRNLPAEWSARGQYRGGSAAQRSLEVILKNPIFTSKTLTENLKVSTPAIMRAIGQLIDKKIIRERTGFNRNRVFAAEDLLQILGRDFGQPISEAKKSAQKLMQDPRK